MPRQHAGTSPISRTPDAAIARARALAQGHMPPAPGGGFFPLPNPQMTHPENTTVFIGGLPGSVGRAELQEVFEPFGTVTYVNIPPSRGCGFISFETRVSAEWAIEQLQGFWLHGSQLRLSWGKPQGDKGASGSKQNELAAQLKLDLPFLIKMLDLSSEQQIRLGLYLEFAASNNIGRLKDILSSADASASLGLTSFSSSSYPPSPPSPSITSTRSSRVQCDCPPAPPGPMPGGSRDPYQSHGELCQHYDRLVSDDLSSVSFASPNVSPPALSISTSVLSSEQDMLSSVPSATPSMKHRAAKVMIRPPPSNWGSEPPFGGTPSIASEKAFGAFHAAAHTHEMAKTPHRHSESCVTPSSLQALAREQQNRSLALHDHTRVGSISSLSWKMGQVGLNGAAKEWRP